MKSRIAGAAALIAVLTVLARIVGFGRSVVFAQAIGADDLGDIYNVANTVPNVVFEIAAGGALAGLVVPLLAGPLAAGDRQAASRMVSALLTWTLTLLVPLALLVAIAADPIVSLLAKDAPPDQHAAGVFLLRIFAPQIPLYGIGLVLGGVLQAHRRFAWFVLSPLLSSVTVITTYVLFAKMAGRVPPLSTVDSNELLLLGVGTSLGVIVLSLCLIIPVSRLGLHLRPTYDIEPSQRSAVGGLATTGVVTVGMQQVAVVVTIILAMAVSDGTLVVFNQAQTVYLLPWAVLAVPLATAAYPDIATAHAVGDRAALAHSVSRTGRAVVLLSCLGAAGLVAVAQSAAHLIMGTRNPGDADLMAMAIAGFAPGLVGYGIGALHQRTLYAVGAYRRAAVGIGLGWVVTVGSAYALSSLMPTGDRAFALAIANSIGMTVLGLALIHGVRQRCGSEAVQGLPRALAAGIVAAVIAAFVSRATTPYTPPGTLVLIGQCMLSGGVAMIVFAAVCAVLDFKDLKRVMRR